MGRHLFMARKVEIVSKYKYLGTIFYNKLNWDVNTEAVLGKG